MSLVIKFYFTSSMVTTFRTLIHPSSGACDFSIVSPLYTIIYTNAKNLHLYRTHDQCGDSTEKSQAPDDGCINVRNMLSIEEVK
jgi:hypothetical protein